jgi:hypothetical protein
LHAGTEASESSLDAHISVVTSTEWQNLCLGEAKARSHFLHNSLPFLLDSCRLPSRVVDICFSCTSLD